MCEKTLTYMSAPSWRVVWPGSCHQPAAAHTRASALVRLISDRFFMELNSLLQQLQRFARTASKPRPGSTRTKPGLGNRSPVFETTLSLLWDSAQHCPQCTFTERYDLFQKKCCKIRGSLGSQIERRFMSLCTPPQRGSTPMTGRTSNSERRTDVQRSKRTVQR